MTASVVSFSTKQRHLYSSQSTPPCIIIVRTRNRRRKRTSESPRSWTHGPCHTHDYVLRLVLFVFFFFFGVWEDQSRSSSLFIRGVEGGFVVVPSRIRRRSHSHDNIDHHRIRWIRVVRSSNEQGEEEQAEASSTENEKEKEKIQPQPGRMLLGRTLGLSDAATRFLHQSNIHTLTPIQQAVLPQLLPQWRKRSTYTQNTQTKKSSKTTKDSSSLSSAIVHAETGSGKTLAYLLPITERLWNINNNYNQQKSKPINLYGWKDMDQLLSSSNKSRKSTAIQMNDSSNHRDARDPPNHHSHPSYGWAVIVTPTAELAAQVALVAQALVPPNCGVRLVTRPTHLFKPSSSSSETSSSSEEEVDASSSQPTTGTTQTQTPTPRIYIGTASAFHDSLFGGAPFPAPPTPKPLAKHFLQYTHTLVLDEVDSLLLLQQQQSASTTTITNRIRMQKKKQQSSKKQKPNNQNYTNINPRTTINTNPKQPHNDEMPAAIVTAATVRYSLGSKPVQVLAVSATIGRTLRRELARVMGLTPQECPVIWRADHSDESSKDEAIETKTESAARAKAKAKAHANAKANVKIKEVEAEEDVLNPRRAVTVPATVQHFIFPVAGAQQSAGKLLTAAHQVIQQILLPQPPQSQQPQQLFDSFLAQHGHAQTQIQAQTQTQIQNASSLKILLVLTRGLGMSTRHAVGALEYLGGCQPLTPVALLDALGEKNHATTNDDNNAGGDNNRGKGGYVRVAKEDSIRGLHLEGLDGVIVVGRPESVDAYTHIAGRTGRAGQSGWVITILERASSIKSWESHLQREFKIVSLSSPSPTNAAVAPSVVVAAPHKKAAKSTAAATDYDPHKKAIIR